MGTGGVSAFAAVRGEIVTPKSPSASASSTDGSQDFLHPNQNSFSALLLDKPGPIPVAPNAIDSDGVRNVRIRLVRNENVFIVGIFSLWVKHGEVSFLGASLGASSTLHHVFVPLTHSTPAIIALSGSAELEISSNDEGKRLFGNVSGHFASLWEPRVMPTALTFHVLGYHSQTAKDVVGEIRLLDLKQRLPPINRVLSHDSGTAPRILFAGAKGTGKSTLCRVLANIMLTRATHGTAAGTKAFPDGILFLDIDPGQPELAAPGIIYLAHLRAPLLGPPFTNLIVPGTEANVMLRMHYIGSYSPRGSPSHYQNCVSNLVALHHNYEHLPLIVNICGWISGYGRTILQSTLQRLVLTDIFYVGDTPNELLDDLMQPAMGGDQKIVTVIPPQPNKTPLKSPSDLREMQLQSYVHALGSYHGHMLWDQLPVTTLPDTLPPASDDINEVFTVIILGQVIAPEYITDALHGSVAALVVIKHDSLLFELSNREGKGRHDANGEMHIAQTKDGQLPYLVYRDRPDNPLDPETSECIGLARVTVDTNSKQLGIKSPISEADMRNEIMKGYRIAVVLAQQQGSWLMMESI